MQPEINVVNISPPCRSKADLIFDIKRNSLDDGPGIRSVVFFKGCPLSCDWCQNPESIDTGFELLFDAEKCIDCDDCVRICPANAIDKNRTDPIVREACTQCFDCVQACPSGALEVVGRDLAVDELTREVLADQPFFEASGGGVTVSGGEPLMQMDRVAELFKRLSQQNIHTLIETSGFFNFRAFEKKVLPYTNTVYMDIKLMQSAAHKRYCGVPNEVILSNFTSLQALAAAGTLDVLPRVPLIPGVTATAENLTAIADFVVTQGAKRIQLLPYNPLFLDKLPKIGGTSKLDLGPRSRKFIAEADIESMTKIFTDRGLEVICH